MTRYLSRRVLGALLVAAAFAALRIAGIEF